MFETNRRTLTVAACPLRISLAGGGTDVPSFYREHSGLVLGFAISRYVTVAVAPCGMSSLRGPSARLGQLFGGQALAKRTGSDTDTQIATFSDVEAGSGLGGSASFLVSLLAALRACDPTDFAQKQEIGYEASLVEIDDLKRGTGHQDHLFAAIGGVRSFTFGRDGELVTSESLLNIELQKAMLRKLSLFRLGSGRDAGQLLSQQSARLESGDVATSRTLLSILELGKHLQGELIKGNLSAIDEVLAEHWKLKRTLAPDVSSVIIDRAHDIAMQWGAGGAKLVGAGGTGYLLVSTSSEDRRASVAGALSAHGFEELTFVIDNVGLRLTQTDLGPLIAT